MPRLQVGLLVNHLPGLNTVWGAGRWRRQRGCLVGQEGRSGWDERHSNGNSAVVSGAGLCCSHPHISHWTWGRCENGEKRPEVYSGLTTNSQDRLFHHRLNRRILLVVLTSLASAASACLKPLAPDERPALSSPPMPPLPSSLPFICFLFYIYIYLYICIDIYK